MADKTYLDWPFLEDSHRKLKSELVDWCEQYTFVHGENVDDICRQLVADLGEAGWLKNCVPGAWGGASEKLDVRSIALCRETLAYYSGLADFSLAMQGLGSDCCEAHDSPGCDTPECEEAICSLWPPCCDTAWDEVCVSGVQFQCGELCANDPRLPA